MIHVQRVTKFYRKSSCGIFPFSESTERTVSHSYLHALATSVHCVFQYRWRKTYILLGHRPLTMSRKLGIGMNPNCSDFKHRWIFNIPQIIGFVEGDGRLQYVERRYWRGSDFIRTILNIPQKERNPRQIIGSPEGGLYRLQVCHALSQTDSALAFRNMQA